MEPGLQTTCFFFSPAWDFTFMAYVVAFLENPLVSNLKWQWIILMKFVPCIKGMLGFSSEHLIRVIVMDIHSCMTLAELWWGVTDLVLQSQVSFLLISLFFVVDFPFLYLKSQKGFRSCFTSFIYMCNAMYSTPLPRIAPYPLPKFCLSLKTQVKSHSLWKVFSPALWLAASWKSGTHTAWPIHLVSSTWCFGLVNLLLKVSSLFLIPHPD